MKLINRITKSISKVYRWLRYILAPKDPVYIFHHIPKCGGASVNFLLNSWFIIIRDYRTGDTTNYPEKTDVSSLRSCHCLTDHFEIDGYYLHQRYPEILINNWYKIITFIRDPLQVQLSLFRYEKNGNRAKAKDIKEHLSLRPNYIANRLPATINNYKKVIDRYFFIGILEESQASVDRLASMIKKRSKPLPWENKSTKEGDKNTDSENISEEIIRQFRHDNALDYLIYDYCVEKFKQKPS